MAIAPVLALAQAAGAVPPTTSAPDVHIATAQIRGVVVVRLKNGVDILAGLKEAVDRQHIRNAVVLSGFGSVTSYHIHVVENSVFPPKDAYIKARKPYDIVGASGYVIGGRVHAHMTFSDTKRAFGGHLEPGTAVFTFCTVTLGILDDEAPVSRIDDFTWR
jgi:predicted DNA-binding protein with PD1-like motif